MFLCHLASFLVNIFTVDRLHYTKPLYTIRKSPVIGGGMADRG